MNKCPKCGFEENESIYNEDSLRKENFGKFIDIVLKRSEKRMRKEMGYGIPEVIKHDPENLGDCITGNWKEWREDDDQRDN